MIQLENIKKIYNKGEKNELVALRDISLQINDGEMVAIIGKSGAGKSTLMHILAGIDDYIDGKYYLDERLIKNLSEKQIAKMRNEKIGIVMQDFALVEEFTALENVLLPLDFAKGRKRNKYEQAYTVLEQVEMGELAEQTVNSMSGGQKQRVAIARAIINNPGLILADEPTGALDSETSEKIMELFKGLHKTGKSIVIITHDKNIAEQCERIIEIKDGRLLNEG